MGLNLYVFLVKQKMHRNEITNDLMVLFVCLFRLRLSPSQQIFGHVWSCFFFSWVEPVLLLLC